VGPRRAGRTRGRHLPCRAGPRPRERRPGLGPDQPHSGDHRCDQRVHHPAALRKIDAAEHAHAREIEALASLPQDSPAVTALRSRIIERFGELEADRAAINQQLAALTQVPAFLEDPALLDRLPTLAGILTDAPQRLQAQLFQALDLQLIYKKDTHQVTIYATITLTTPHALSAIINTSEPPANLDPSPEHQVVIISTSITIQAVGRPASDGAHL